MTTRNAGNNRFTPAPQDDEPARGWQKTARSVFRFAEIVWMVFELVMALGEIVSLFF